MKRRRIDTLRAVAGAALFAALLIFAGPAFRALDAQARPGAGAVNINLGQQDGGRWRLEYALASPVAELDLGPALNGFRGRDWRVETSGLRLVSEDGRDRLVARGGRSFDRARISIRPRPNGFAKQYEPISPFGTSDAVLYTGHFIPYAEDGWRYDAVFDIRPARGGSVYALGERAPAFSDWRSPLRHPAFVHVGRDAPVGAGGARAVIDPALPPWTRQEAVRLAAAMLDHYSAVFGTGPEIPPDIFIMKGADETPGVLRFDGDALPGQLAAILSGGGWEEESGEGRTLLAEALAHEIAHIWQTRARPRGQDVPDWIHEGGANALAAEALAAIGADDHDGPARRLAAARMRCADSLNRGALSAAEAGGVWTASYACGHVLSAIAARAHDPFGLAGVFWRDFVARAEAEGGYDEALFLAMIEEAAGPAFAREVRRFPRTAFARPDRELGRLLRRAEAAGAAGPASP